MGDQKEIEGLKSKVVEAFDHLCRKFSRWIRMEQ